MDIDNHLYQGAARKKIGYSFPISAKVCQVNFVMNLGHTADLMPVNHSHSTKTHGQKHRKLKYDTGHSHSSGLVTWVRNQSCHRKLNLPIYLRFITKLPLPNLADIGKQLPICLRAAPTFCFDILNHSFANTSCVKLPRSVVSNFLQSISKLWRCHSVTLTQ